MEQVTQQNAAFVEETIAAWHLFEDEVEKLQEVVGHFKLDRAEALIDYFAWGLRRIRMAPQAAP